MTGFGPFPGVPSNASAALVSALAACPLNPEVLLATEIIPVDWTKARRVAAEAIARTKPDAVLHFGVAKRLTQIEIETRALNMSGPKADNSGAASPWKRLAPGGPFELPATLPALRLLRALKQNGFHAGLSRNAGGYLCNAVFYWSLAAAADEGPLIGFVHIPALGLTSRELRITPEDLLSAAIVLIRSSARAVLVARRRKFGFPGGKKHNGPQILHEIRRGSRGVVRHLVR
ncbi:MAG: hypothetical protein WBX25_15575 [Rhodomicrobium sp.]